VCCEWSNARLMRVVGWRQCVLVCLLRLSSCGVLFLAPAGVFRSGCVCVCVCVCQQRAALGTVPGRAAAGSGVVGVVGNKHTVMGDRAWDGHTTPHTSTRLTHRWLSACSARPRRRHGQRAANGDDSGQRPDHVGAARSPRRGACRAQRWPCGCLVLVCSPCEWCGGDKCHRARRLRPNNADEWLILSDTAT
jgi:hypothetical protein